MKLIDILLNRPYCKTKTLKTGQLMARLPLIEVGIGIVAYTVHIQ